MTASHLQRARNPLWLLLVVLTVLGFLALAPASVQATFFYLPGVPPQEYRLGDSIPIKVGLLCIVDFSLQWVKDQPHLHLLQLTLV